jgi:ATP-dependent Clp protease ATP-binding subunit ClpC
VIEEAQQSAFSRAQPAYDQEDLLLGIAMVPGSAGLEVLRRLGVSQEQLRADAEAVVAAAPGPPSGSGSLNINRSRFAVRAAPRAQATLALAVDEALLLGHPYLGVEHLLLGILRQGAGPGYDVLTHLGVRLDPARAALRTYIAQACTCDACRSGTGTCP